MIDEPHELVIDRLIDAPVDAVWRAWTDHLEEWWCPRPWRAEVIEHDLRAGGRSAITLHGPGGEVMPNEGVFLEVVPRQRIVFTDAFSTGWIPKGPFIVGFAEMADQAGRTRYRTGARHWTAEAMQQHEAMGFREGWGVMLDQLEAVAKRLA